MKKLLLFIFGLCSFLGYSQTEEIKEKKNEIKINLPYFIYGLPELSYERIIDDTSAAGISFAFSLDKPEDVNTRWMITPYYRLYFSRGTAKGFFIEGDLTVLNQKIPDSYNYNTNETISIETTNVGFGAATGYKFLNKNGYVGEAYVGAMRLYGIDSDSNFQIVYPRVGLSIGKRF